MRCLLSWSNVLIERGRGRGVQVGCAGPGDEVAAKDVVDCSDQLLSIHPFSRVESVLDMGHILLQSLED